jgi:hypothetical protein
MIDQKEYDIMFDRNNEKDPASQQGL